MRHSIHVILYVAVIAVLSSCSRQTESLSDYKFHTLSFDCHLPSMEDVSGKAYTGSFVGPKWSEGDAVSVINLSRSTVLGDVLTADGSGQDVTFSGTVTGTISDGDLMALIYPAFSNSAEMTLTENTFDFSRQTGGKEVKMVAWGGFTATNASTLYAGMKVKFTIPLSYIKMNLANLPENTLLDSLTVTGVNDALSMSAGTSGTLSFSPVREKGKITISSTTGPVTDKEGSLAVSVAVPPTAQEESRELTASIGLNDFISPFPKAQLNPNSYYNTILSKFTTIPFGHSTYGTYLLEGEVTVSSLNETTDQIQMGATSSQTDFSIVSPTREFFWTLKGIPSSLETGDVFEAGFSSYGVPGFPSEDMEVKVLRMQSDGDITKIWLTSEDFIFIISKF